MANLRTFLKIPHTHLQIWYHHDQETWTHFSCSPLRPHPLLTLHHAHTHLLRVFEYVYPALLASGEKLFQDRHVSILHFRPQYNATKWISNCELNLGADYDLSLGLQNRVQQDILSTFIGQWKIPNNFVWFIRQGAASCFLTGWM